MADAILVEHYAIPEKGQISVRIDRSFTIYMTAADARRQVDSWLHDEVSYMIGAGEPLFVVDGENALWRVPAIFTAPHIGAVGTAGVVDVDMQTGEMLQLAQCKVTILHGAQTLADKMPPYTKKASISQAYLAQNLAPTITAPKANPLEILAATT